MQNSYIANNIVSIAGGAYNILSNEYTIFNNVTFENNVGQNGGAGSCKDIAKIYQSTFRGNNAQLGGALYADDGCR